MPKTSRPRPRRAQRVKRRNVRESYEFDILADLLVNCMRDTSDLLGIPLDRDIKTVQERYKSEGFGFISKTLPLFADWLRSCLAEEHLRPCQAFKTYTFKQGGKKVPAPFPSFLKGLVMELAYEDGSLKIATTPAQRELQTEVLKLVELICTGFGKKYELPLPPDMTDGQVRKWFESDRSVFNYAETDPPDPASLAAGALSIARDLVHEVFKSYLSEGVSDKEWGVFDNHFSPNALEIQHGSGATSFGLANYEKYTRLLGFPLSCTHLSGYSAVPSLLAPDGSIFDPYEGGGERLKSWLRGGVSKVAVVPKNSKKGRIICMEPIENMMVQQGWRKLLYEWIEKHPITRSFINFTDQTVNGELALLASQSGYHATLDLKAASDSVSVSLVRLLFPETVVDWLCACRSRFARATISTYKGGKVDGKIELSAKLQKFAPMGSAVCFPVEALCFWALARGTLIALGASDTRVWVYGDDTILPAEYTDKVETVYAMYGLTLNREKSFSTGNFRESCGVDAYDGTNVTPGVRCSTRLPGFGIKKRMNKQKKDAARASSIVAWVEYANKFEELCLPRVSRRIRHHLRKLWPSSASFPVLSEACLSSIIYYLDYEKGKNLLSYGRNERKPEGTLGEYKFSPHFPDPSSPWVSAQDDQCNSPVQGELYVQDTTPWYGGRVLNTWVIDNEPHRCELSESERYLRWNMEHGADSKSDMFVARENLRLKRKRVRLS